jgi:NADP-dependent 3-hydroxy acid dehydrogenase YdfG
MPSIDESKCVLITGATSGIGRALALDIIKLPSHPVVIGTGRRKERLEELGKAGIHPVELSITLDFDALKNKVDEIIQEYPDVNIFVLLLGYI